MSPLRVVLAVMFMVFLGSAEGCTGHTGGRFYESPAWDQRGGSLGKVEMIVTGDIYESGGDGDQSDVRAARADKVAAALKGAVAQLPETTLVDDIATFPAKRAMGDQEAIALARSHGAQSVCVVHIANIGGRFSIGFLPPLLPAWSCESYALYTIRVLDVSSGDVLASVLTHRVQGGMYNFCDWDDCYKGFAVDLRAPQAAGSGAAAVDH